MVPAGAESAHLRATGDAVSGIARRRAMMGSMILSDRFDEALLYAARLHREQLPAGHGILVMAILHRYKIRSTCMQLPVTIWSR